MIFDNLVSICLSYFNIFFFIQFQIVDLDDDEDEDLRVVVNPGPPPLPENTSDIVEKSLSDILARKLKEKAMSIAERPPNDISLRMTHSVIMDIITAKVGFSGTALLALYACDVKQQVQQSQFKNPPTKK